MAHRSPVLLGLKAVFVVYAFALAACGAPATAPDPGVGGGVETPQPDSGSSGTAANPLEGVYAELEGLEGDARRERLAELARAEEEGGGFSHYTSMNLDNSGPVADAFEEEYGIAQELYRATGTTIVQRVTQESQAGYAGSDVISLNGTELFQIDGAGILAPLEVSSAEDLAEVHDTWVSNYLNVFIAAWNTNLVADAPESWADVLTGYEGQLSMESGDFDWFTTLVQEHLVTQEGMSEDEAIELVRQAADDAYAVDGHTVQNELLASGEFGLAASVYLHNTLQQIENGAPLGWNDPEPVQPLIVRSNGIGINVTTDRPASALLFVEYMVDDAQEQIAGFGRTPANRSAPGGIPEEYETITVDLEALLEEQDEWRGLYEEIMRQASISEG